MSLTELMKPCTILRRTSGTTKDTYGNKKRGTERVDGLAFIQPQGRSLEQEPAKQDQTSDTDWLGVFPIDTELGSADGVEQDGEEYEVVGRPWKAETGSASLHHLEANLRQVKGPEDSK